MVRNPLTVLSQVYFDVTMDGEPAGRVVIGLFGNDVPKTVYNFYHLCKVRAGRQQPPRGGI